MWIIGLYLLLGLMTWVVYDKAAEAMAKERNLTPEEVEEEKSDALGMVTLIAAWPVYLCMWFRDRDYDDGS